MTHEPHYVREYGEALMRIGIDAFLSRYRTPVLIGEGFSADVADRPRQWGRRTLKTTERSELNRVQSIVDRVWQIRKDPGAPRGKYITMGQSADNDIVLPDYTISTVHCAFLWEPRRLMVLDMGSLNGTWLDDERLDAKKPTVLKDGALLTIGRVNMRFKTAEAFRALCAQAVRMP